MKKRIIDEIIRIEGGYVDDPDDSGGKTKFGVTLKAARAFGYLGEMADLPREVAFKLYVAKYWDAVRADELAKLSDAIAEEVVDTAVNMGVGRASRFLQRALNALNGREQLYADVLVDGHVGPATIEALKEYLSIRDDDVLAKALNCLQGAFYLELVERREKDERFIYGWLRNRVEL